MSVYRTIGPLVVSEKKIFEYFFENLPFMLPHQPITLSDLDESRMKCGVLLNRHFCKKKKNIPNDAAEIVNFHYSHYKSMETISCHSNQSSFSTGIKNITFCSHYQQSFTSIGMNVQRALR